MTILAEKLQAALAAKASETQQVTEPEPKRRGLRENKGLTKRMMGYLRQRAGRGATANEAGHDLGVDAATAASCLSQLHKQSKVYRQGVHENHGPHGGSRYRYFYLEDKARQSKPKPANVAPPKAWVEEDDNAPGAPEVSDTPDIFAKPTFKLETRKVYFMVLSNGKEVEITAQQYSALGGVW